MQRRMVASVTLPQGDTFRFGTWYPLEDFIILLQAGFEDSIEKETLLRVLGNVTGSEAATSEDDGITQTVAVRVGVSLKERETIKNPVRLRPYRTFRELDGQPESPFILRIKGTDMKMVALFEADGGAWQHHAVELICRWLVAKTHEREVIAPVI